MLLNCVAYFYFTLQKEKGIVEDAHYFIKFALGSYGWPLYVYMNPCSGPWNLCGHIRWVCLSTSDHCGKYLQLLGNGEGRTEKVFRVQRISENLLSCSFIYCLGNYHYIINTSLIFNNFHKYIINFPYF